MAFQAVSSQSAYSVGIDSVLIGPPMYLSAYCSPSGAGYLSIPSSYYDYGSSLYIWPYENYGYAFRDWTVDGVYGGTTKPLNVIMDRPHNVVANYDTISYILIQSPSPQGTGYTSVAPGYYTTSQHIQAYAYSGWEFDHWQISSDPPNYDNPIDVTCSGWKTVTPVFVEEQPTCDLTVNAYLYDIPGSINVYIDYNWVGYTEYNAYVPTGNHYICTYDTEIYIPDLGMYAYLAGIQVNGGDIYSPPGIEISLPQDPTTITFYYQIDWGLVSSPKQQAMLSQALQKMDWSAAVSQSSR